jgi:hypothetical protein
MTQSSWLQIYLEIGNLIKLSILQWSDFFGDKFSLFYIFWGENLDFFFHSSVKKKLQRKIHCHKVKKLKLKTQKNKNEWHFTRHSASDTFHFQKELLLRNLKLLFIWEGFFPWLLGYKTQAKQLLFLCSQTYIWGPSDEAFPNK